jgi:sterol desaturase/sphingolipid hydroxylase (fatty acid hydroxylase superfamily)
MSTLLAQAEIVARTLLPLAALFALLAIATKGRAVLGALRRCRREAVTNAGLVLINYILLAPLMLIPVLAVEDVVPVPSALTRVWSLIPELGLLFLAIALIELAAYWRHRIEHDPALWRFHATHHADEELHWLSVLRKHPVSKFMEMLADTLPALLLGLPAWSVVAAQLVRSWWSYFIHADLPWTLGWAGRWLMSPAAHRLHHIRDEALMGSNYGNMLTVWDRAFGTWRDPAPHIGCPTGIAEGTRGIWGELVRPWEPRYRAAAPAAESPRELA